MAIMRPNPPTRNYGKHSHTWARDSTLSSKAKAILLSICSHAGNYDLTVKQIVSEVAEGYDAVNAGIRELETRGIIKRTRRRTSAGTLGGYDWIVIDPPEPAAGGDQSGNSATGRDQEEQDVSAAQDQSGISGTGGDQGKDGDCAGGDQSRKSRTGDDQQEQGVSAGGNQSGISGPKKIKDSQEEDQKSLSGEAPPSVPSPRVPERERGESVSQKPEPLDPIRKILAEHGWTGDRANHAITYIDTLPGGPKGQGWYRRLAGNGDLAGILASMPEHPTTPKISYGEHMKAVAGMPPCKHGDPGGNIPKPDDGWKPCAACRWETASQQPRSGQRCASPRVHVDPPERSRGIVGAVASELVGTPRRLSTGDKNWLASEQLARQMNAELSIYEDQEGPA